MKLSKGLLPADEFPEVKCSFPSGKKIETVCKRLGAQTYRLELKVSKKDALEYRDIGDSTKINIEFTTPSTKEHLNVRSSFKW